MENIRVLIVDDLPQVREGLAILLKLAAKGSCPTIEVIGEAINGYEAVQQAQRLHPDVILMDLEMPVLDGYEAARQIKASNPSCRVIALSIHSSDQDQQKAFKAGVDDFVMKGASYQKLLNAILPRDQSTHTFDQEKGEKS